MSKRTSLLILSAALALASCKEEAVTSYTPSKAEAVYEVQTVHPAFNNKERTFLLNGRVRAYTRADVRPQVNGIILERLFEEGAYVREGTPLYRIDPALFEAAVDYAKASYERAVVRRKTAAKDYERFELLYRRRSASEKEKDDAKLNLELAAADEKLCLAELKKAEISLSYTNVTAPVSGIIGASKVTRGALVSANQAEPLATIIDLDKVYVDVEQSATDRRQMREGLIAGDIYLGDRAYDVSLYFQDYTLYSHLGVLSLSEVIVNEDTGAVKMSAVFDNPEHLLLPGMAVMCKINGGVSQNVMTLPSKAVMRDPKGNAYVFTVEGDRAVQTPVTLGVLFSDGWQITDGLDSTYEVVISGAAGLNHGSKVRVTVRDGVDVTLSEEDRKRLKDTQGALQEVNNPTTTASGLDQSSASVPASGF